MWYAWLPPTHLIAWSHARSCHLQVVYALNTSMGNNSVRAVWDALNYVLQRGSRLQYVTSEGLLQHLLKLGETDMDAYSRNYLVAVELTDTSSLSDGNETVLATGFFNAQAYHAIGMALAALDEAILKYVSKNAYSLQITNHPLPRTTVSQWEEDVQESTTSGFSLAILLIFGMSFLVSQLEWTITSSYTLWGMRLLIPAGVKVDPC